MEDAGIRTDTPLAPDTTFLQIFTALRFTGDYWFFPGMISINPAGVNGRMEKMKGECAMKSGPKREPRPSEAGLSADEWWLNLRGNFEQIWNYIKKCRFLKITIA